MVFTVSALNYLQVQWLKLCAWKAGDHVFVPRLGIQASKKQNVSSSLIRKDSNLMQYCVRPQTTRARILLAQLSQYVQKGGLQLYSFIYSFIHSSFTHLFTHSLIHSIINSLIYSFILSISMSTSMLSITLPILWLVMTSLSTRLSRMMN